MAPFPDWLGQSFQPHGGPTPAVLAGRLLLALLLGWAVAAVYRWTHRAEPVTPTFPPTLILLTLLIATVTQVIGDNVARAFSLVGTLSIVRFRTVVQDTRDTAFVIFAVVEGMAVGASDLWVALLALVIIGAAAILGEPRLGGARVASAPFHLVVRVPAGNDPDTPLQRVSDGYLEQAEVIAVATAGKGLSLEATYAVRLRPDAAPTQLVNALNALDGVQSVSLERRENGSPG
jgi:hypothetical protein